jgi:hypothetical protein
MLVVVLMEVSIWLVCVAEVAVLKSPLAVASVASQLVAAAAMPVVSAAKYALAPALAGQT